MKFTAEAVRDFLAILPQYEGLTQFQRNQLLQFDRRTQSYASWDLGNTLPLLIKAGFVVQASHGRVPMEPSHQASILMLRSLLEHAVFDHSGEGSFSRYLEEHFTVAEQQALRGNSPWNLYPVVTSPDWVQGFLNATDASWEEPYRVPGEASLFADPEVLRTTQSIVRWLMGQEDGRVILRDLPAPADPTLRSDAIHAGLRYALLFADIDSRTMEVTVGVWPSVLPEPPKDLPLPRNVTPEETFDPIFLLEDMTALLVSFAEDPPPLRSPDNELYAPKVRQLARLLRPLPKWVDQEFDMDRELRVPTTVTFLYAFKLVEEVGERYGQKHLYVSDEGEAWIALPAGDRLRVLLDGVLHRKQSVPAFEDFKGAGVGATTDRFEIDTKVPVPNISAAMLSPFRALEGSGFYAMREVAEYGQATNPLLEIYRNDPGAWLKSDSEYLNRPSRSKLRKAWADALHHFLRARLVPTGCVRLGRSKDGLSIAITPAGRYFLGQTKEWQAADPRSQVIVQPNFDVTFFGEAAVAEAEIGLFAERRGRTGVRFQITKKSILAAAMKGMTADQVLAILERVSTREVPANVRREIQGWFGQYREINVDSVIVIRCPDQETAMRVMALAKNLVKPLTDTLLEYRNPDFRQHDGLVKKLQEMGVRVLVQGQPSDSNRYRKLIGY